MESYLFWLCLTSLDIVWLDADADAFDPEGMFNKTQSDPCTYNQPAGKHGFFVLDIKRIEFCIEIVLS